MTDRLTLTRAFEGAGIQSEAAERIATEIYAAISDNVATKQDLERIEAQLRADLQRIEAGLKADVTAARADTREMEQRLTLRFEQTERRIDQVVTRLGAIVVIIAGLLFAALHYWPPHSSP